MNRRPGDGIRLVGRKLTIVSMLIAVVNVGVATAATVPAPPRGEIERVRTFPYSATVPSFPRSVPGYKLQSRRRVTHRVFKGDRWREIYGFPGAFVDTCGERVWIVRWRSANPDVTVSSAVGAIIPRVMTGSISMPGGAGYISGLSCVEPMLRFAGTLRGNRATLADIYIEWQIWEPKI